MVGRNQHYFITGVEVQAYPPTGWEGEEKEDKKTTKISNAGNYNTKKGNNQKFVTF